MGELTILRSNAVLNKGLHRLGFLRREADLLLKDFKCLDDVDADIVLFSAQRRLRTLKVGWIKILWHVDNDMR
ncbi:hypothetical protein [Pseudomonas rubra]|uniref:Uncharacterized protein n=1 Tax=Pseudomonas rubra TaxID=2942627 RepID=A0ABT5PD82_9PSED|nr:hypothetical protein [Pseudomonas rubra]MDD1015993.1 hypothetical protein [Pseudomonas rubra]MDD1039236.1 hypothetical protein [Pseudomonas rubra]MDD1155206.1 hypothetical protein [Pseudomonas rubra]